MILFGKELDINSPPIYVAEISCNHGGSIDQAKYLILKAYQAGADAVKIQTFVPTEITLQSDNEDFKIKEGLWKDRNMFALYTKAQTPIHWIPELFAFAKENGIPIFSSVFGFSSLVFLEQLNCPVYKIASFENEFNTLIQDVINTRKPLIISVGGIDGDQYDGPFADNIIHMHCVSKYPCSLEEANLSNITRLRDNFCNHVGFSDHTRGSRAAEYAVMLGARIIEKHFTELTTTEDAAFSASPEQFKSMVAHCNSAFFAWEKQKPEFIPLKRSVYVLAKIKEGEVFTYANLTVVRPNYGLAPYMLEEVIGKTATRDLEFGTALKKEYVKW